MKTRNLKTKALSILLAIVMLLGMLPLSVFAAGVSNGVITLTPADLVDGASGEGWSFDGILNIEDGYRLVFEGECSVNVGNLGTIENGIFNSSVFNPGTIEDGTFNNYVENHKGTIRGGNFYAPVKNTAIGATIAGGSFHGDVTNYRTITGGTFLNTVENLMGTIEGGTFAGKLTNNQGSISDITIELSNALIQGGESYGWSLDEDNKLILNSGITFYWKAGEECGYVVDNDGTISGGTFNSKVKNDGTISGGTFGNDVTNQGTITNGIFSGGVLNNDTISGGTFSGNVGNNTVSAVISNGTFSGNVTNYGTISGGTFSGDIDNYAYIEGGSFRCYIDGIADIPGVTLIHSPGTEWESDGTNHWHECSCGEKEDEAAHNGGTATCKDKAVCSVCGTAYGNLAEHTYGNATCEAPATCSECGATTGDALGHKDENTDHTCDRGCGKTNMGTHADSATDTDHLCDHGCGATLENCTDAVNDNNHSCDVCGKADVSEHTYGDATCEAPATCSECGATTGDSLGHKDDNKDHTCDRGCGKTDVGTHADSSTDTDHVCDYGCGATLENCTDAVNDNNHSCDVCGKTNVSTHTYGNAACEAPAACSECGATTGDSLGHKDDNTDHTCDRGCGKTDVGIHAAATGKHTCDYCSAAVSTCKDDDENHICDICGAELTHNYSTEWKSDGTNHWHECSCGDKTDVAAHNGGTASCTDKAKCVVCAEEYGELAAHTYGTEWKSDGTNHWHECTCGAKADEAAHNGGTATCTVKAACSACSVTYGELAAHTYKDGKCTVCEAADPNYVPESSSPQTGDNSNMALWIALLFISGGAVISLTVYDRKRRNTVKH